MSSLIATSSATAPGPRFAYSPLPRPLTSIVGREAELAETEALLARPETQILTLTGPGGVGKSRLALQIAARLRASLADGATFVSLAAVRDPDLVLPAIAHQLRLDTSGRDEPGVALADALSDREMLLVLDNFEQIVEAAPALTPLVEQCPRLTLLVTSRVRLRLSSERVVTIRPLSVAAAPGETSPAVRLFLARASAARSDFALSAAEVPTVNAICARLDGLPLAIELAAARVAQLPPHALLARLSPGLPMLSGGARDLPERQQTMRATIAWSYDLLPAEVQCCFRWLAVFVGGFTLTAAEDVCHALDAGLDVLASVTTLADHNLLRFAEGTEAETRYIMLETIREFGLQELAVHDDGDGVSRAHAAWALGLAEQVGRLPTVAWLQHLDAERGNMTAALAWLERQGQAEPFLRLVAALGRFWDAHGPLATGRRWLDAALAQAPPAPSAARVIALSWAGLLDRAAGETDRAMAREEEALASARALGEPGPLADALHSLGQVLVSKGELARAAACYEEAVSLYRTVAGGLWVFPLLNLGIVALQQGQSDRARATLDAALTELRRTDHAWGAGFALRGLADLARREGDLAGARTAYAESIAYWRDYGYLRGIAYALLGLLAISPGAAQPVRAAWIMGAAEKIREDYGLSLWPSELAAYERARSAVASRLGPAEMDTAQADGARLTLEDAVSEALALSAGPGPADGRVTHDALPITLTPREEEVLRLLVEGKSDHEIATDLFVSTRTVQNHVSHVLSKLGVESRTAAAIFAVRHGLT